MDKATVERAISKARAADCSWVGYDWQRGKWKIANLSDGRDTLYRGSTYWYRVDSYDPEAIIEDIETAFAW